MNITVHMNTAEIVTPKWASAITGLATRKLARLFDEGNLRGTVTMGGQRRYLREDVVALIPDED